MILFFDSTYWIYELLAVNKKRRSIVRTPLRYIYNKIIIALLKDLDNLIQLAQDQKAKLIN